MKPRLYDAHNHLHDDRFGGQQEELLAACARAGVVRLVVNGSCEADWPQVLALARAHPEVLPSFGYHPWYIHERSPPWLERLEEFLAQVPSGVGEIGLDRWKPGLSYADQEEVFVAQLRLAAERHRPVSIHCLQAWGRLLDLLRATPRPSCGFLLHSFGGPAEMIRPLAELGAYFGLPGYFAHARKHRQRETFRRVPLDRLLIETDAPDQLLPHPDEADPTVQETLRGLTLQAWTDPATGRPINHPAHLPAVYACAALWLQVPLAELAAQVEANFLRLFGGLLPDGPA